MLGTISDLEQMVTFICAGKSPKAFFAYTFPPELQPLVLSIKKWYQMMLELESYATALTKGNLDVDTPPRSNYLAAGLKSIHVQLNHLTWQAEQVAQGDYEQVVDFMGNFSAAFNKMTQQLKHRAESLEMQHATMLRIFDHLDSLIIVSAQGDKVPLFINRTTRQIFGIEEGQTIDIENPPPLLVLLWDMLDKKKYGVQELMEPTSANWYRILATPINWMATGEAILCSCSDITEQKNLENMLTEVAATDALTGLLNRRGYEGAADREWGRCVRKKVPISLLMIDVDFFKKYNDTYGHIQGDQCLKALAACLRSKLNRSTDVIARIGGEEFVVLLPCTAQRPAWLMAEKLREAVSKMVIERYGGEEHGIDEGHQHITISVGVASVTPTVDMHREILLLQADKALYQAKQQGRNRSCLYESS